MIEFISGVIISMIEAMTAGVRWLGKRYRPPKPPGLEGPNRALSALDAAILDSAQLSSTITENEVRVACGLVPVNDTVLSRVFELMDTFLAKAVGLRNTTIYMKQHRLHKYWTKNSDGGVHATLFDVVSIRAVRLWADARGCEIKCTGGWEGSSLGDREQAAFTFTLESLDEARQARVKALMERRASMAGAAGGMSLPKNRPHEGNLHVVPANNPDI